MPDLIVLVPSRGRPEQAAELADTFNATCTAGTQLMVCLDADDPTLKSYEISLEGLGAATCIGPSHTMVEALNAAASGLMPFAVGFMGDDHRPRTVGWDTRYLEELQKLGTGIVYGNDLLQGHNLPTQCAMTSDIVRALGYMAPPTLTHMYVDNFWLSLGRAADCIRYLPDVVVEHMHPIAGKSEWTEGHQRVNAQDMYSRDRSAFRAYADKHFAADVAKVNALRAVHV